MRRAYPEVYPGARRALEGLVATGNEEKRAENEAAFRDANEQIRAAERRLDPPLERVPYICECDDVACSELIRLTAEEYERVREDGATFVIARDHPTQGNVIEQYEEYLVVHKPDGGGAEVVRALDPRKEEA
jgi:hypothetical protein